MFSSRRSNDPHRINHKSGKMLVAEPRGNRPIGPKKRASVVLYAIVKMTEIPPSWVRHVRPFVRQLSDVCERGVQRPTAASFLYAAISARSFRNNLGVAFTPKQHATPLIHALSFCICATPSEIDISYLALFSSILSAANTSERTVSLLSKIFNRKGLSKLRDKAHHAARQTYQPKDQASRENLTFSLLFSWSCSST